MPKATLLAAALALVGTAPGVDQPAPVCQTLDTCIAELRADGPSASGGYDPAQYARLTARREQFVRFGDAAVESLLPLLTDANRQVRDNAGDVLARFPHIEPRHLPALVRAWGRGDSIDRRGEGNGWMPRAIAATGTDEALRLLWEDFERNPNEASNSAVFFALAVQIGERIRPLLLARMARCRDRVGDDVMAGDYSGPCAGNYELLHVFRPSFPAWGLDALADVALNGGSDQLRELTERRLAFLHHPAVLPPIQRRLAALAANAARSDPAEDNAYGLLMTVADYGAAARESGPAIALFLDRRFDRSLRTAAAKAAGRAGNPVTVPGLLAQERDLADSWSLAMEVAEGLGRLRAPEARPLLERLASSHWHRAVRDAATEALAGLADPSRIIFAAATPRDDPFDGPSAARCHGNHGPGASLGQNPAGPLRWPARGAAEITIRPIGEAAAMALRRRIPVQLAQGSVQFAYPVRDGMLVGIDGGEFGGGLIHLPDAGPPMVIPATVAFAWRMGGKLFVASGLSHMSIDSGSLLIVDTATVRVERSIQLPASPRGLRALASHVAVVSTARGDLAIREDGELVNVEQLPACTDE